MNDVEVLMKVSAGRLKAMLKEKGMSQRDLAAMLGVSDASVSRWTAGKRAPTFRHAVHCADILDVSIFWLWYGAGDELKNLWMEV